MKQRTMSTRWLALGIVVLFATVGCMSTRSTGSQVEDHMLASKVKSKLAADLAVNPFEIDVDDHENGVIRLSGTVDDVDDRAEAERIALGTSGVTRVINDIQVGSKSPGDHLDDAVLTAKIKTKLAAASGINPFNIDVDSENGIVTLSGRVPEASDRREAEEIALETKGVVRVINRIQVGHVAAR